MKQLLLDIDTTLSFQQSFQPSNRLVETPTRPLTAALSDNTEPDSSQINSLLPPPIQTSAPQPLSKDEKRRKAQAENKARQQAENQARQAEKNRRKQEESAATEKPVTQNETPPLPQEEKKPETSKTNSDPLSTAISDINRTKEMIGRYLKKIQDPKNPIMNAVDPKELKSKVTSFELKINELDNYASQTNQTPEALKDYIEQIRKDLEQGYAWIETQKKEQAALEKKRSELEPYLTRVGEILTTYKSLKASEIAQKAPSKTNQNLSKLLRSSSIFDLEPFNEIEENMETLRRALLTINEEEARKKIAFLLYTLRESDQCNVGYYNQVMISFNTQLAVFRDELEKLSQAFAAGKKINKLKLNEIEEIKSKSEELEKVRGIFQNTYNQLDAWISDAQSELYLMRRNMTAPELNPHLFSLYTTCIELHKICTNFNQNNDIPEKIRMDISFLLLNTDLAAYFIMNNDLAAAYGKIIETEKSAWYESDKESRFL